MERAASEHEKEIERLRNDSERKHAERMEEIEKLKSDMTAQLSAKVKTGRFHLQKSNISPGYMAY